MVSGLAEAHGTAIAELRAAHGPYTDVDELAHLVDSAKLEWQPFGDGLSLKVLHVFDGRPAFAAGMSTWNLCETRVFSRLPLLAGWYIRRQATPGTGTRLTSIA